MFRRLLPRFSASLDAVIGASVSAKWTPVSTIARQLDEDSQELVGEKFGGLSNYFKTKPSDFDVDKKNGSLVVRRRPIVLPSAPKQPVHVPVTEMSKPVISSPRSDPASNAPRPTIPSSIRKEVDTLFCRVPTFTVPLSAMATAENVTVEKLVDEFSSWTTYLDVVELNGEHFVRVLPPFAREAFAVAQTKSPTANDIYQDYQVEGYDAYRLARFLSTTDFLGFSGLIAVGGSVCAKAVLHVVASYPELFDVDPALGVKFLLSSQYWAKPDQKALEEYRDDTFEQVEAKLREVVRESKKGAFTYGVFMKKRRTLIHALQAKKFPKGNVLQDERVLAYYLFDLLPTDGPILLTELKSQLPDNARYTANPSPGLLKKFDHLFFLHEEKASQWFVQRADLPRPELRRPEDLTEEEVIHCIFSALPGDFDVTRSISFSTIVQSLEKVVRDRLHQLGGPQKFMKKYPNSFRQDVSREGDMWFVVDQRIGSSSPPEEEDTGAASSSNENTNATKEAATQDEK